MIAEFSITNFGSIREKQTLSLIADNKNKTLEDYYITETGGLRLLKLAMLYGPNASGKTTILKAIDALRDLILNPKSRKSESLEIYPFQFNSAAQQSHSEFQLTFVHQEIRYNYSLEVADKYILREKMLYYPNGRQAELFHRETNTENQTSKIHTGSKSGLSNKGIAALEGNTLWNNTVIGAFGKTNVDWPEMQKVQEWFKDVLQKMIEPVSFLDLGQTIKRLESVQEYNNFIISLLAKADIQIEAYKIEKEERDLGIQEIRVTPQDTNGQGVQESQKVVFYSPNTKLTQKSLLFRHKIINEDGEIRTVVLPYDFQSHGTKQYLSYAVTLALLIHLKKCILIDELETALHPDLVKHFLLLFLANSKQSQLIITTHNIQLFEERDILREDAVWFTEKQANGSTSLYSLADFDSSTLRKTPNAIINAYRSGKLGAKPNPGSVFMNIMNE